MFTYNGKVVALGEDFLLTVIINDRRSTKY